MVKNTILVIFLIQLTNVTCFNESIAKNSKEEKKYFNDFDVKYDDITKCYIKNQMVDSKNSCNIYQENSTNPHESNGVEKHISKRAIPIQLILGDKQVITPEKLEEMRNNFLYWFFDNSTSFTNADYLNDISEFDQNFNGILNFELPFFGFRYKYLTVSLNGYIGFSDFPETEDINYPLVFPSKSWPRRKDPSFIGIFYSKCRVGKIYETDIDQRPPGLYFRLVLNLHNATNKLKVAIRERVTNDIRESIISGTSFLPKHVIIVTWKNITFAGGTESSLYITNTFQIVLATDEYHTFAIFNYGTIAWTTHIEAGGDQKLGIGGVPAFVGFNAGDGTESFEYTPYSQTDSIWQLVNTGYGNNFMGRHIFQIDHKIVVGSCNPYEDLPDPQLAFSPVSGVMLGGTVVDITGPCFQLTQNVLCRFENEVVPGYIVDINRAKCVQPYLNIEGYIPFEVFLEKGSKIWSGIYFVETPKAITNGDLLVDGNIYKLNPTEIYFSWNIQKFGIHDNLSISVWGYKETNKKLEFIYLHEIYNEISNIGYFHAALDVMNPRLNYTYDDDLQFGFAQITSENTKKEIKPLLWSKLLPLDWYFRPQWEKFHGRNWSSTFCQRWLKQDSNSSHFSTKLPPCPCNLDQALNDKGRFVPDIERYKNAGYYSLTKEYFQCFRGSHPSYQGSEQQCCYNNKGVLMLNQDNTYGSRPRQIHTIGQSILPAWYNDIRPFYLCCLWGKSDSDGCTVFRNVHRPSTSCQNYEGPKIAAIFGGLHYITFDNLHYTFNGMGEFVIARGYSGRETFEIQGRFQKVGKKLGEQKHNLVSTHLTSVAAKGTKSTIIEVKLRPKNAQWRYRLDVLADGREIYFDNIHMRFQSFYKVNVYTPEHIKNQCEVIIIFSSGVGIEITESNGFMAARIYIPRKFFNNTSGLLGNSNFDNTDEFMLPTGKRLDIADNNFEHIHYEFGLYWMLSDKKPKYLNTPLFSRKYGRTTGFYANKGFKPNFIREPVEFLSRRAEAIIEEASDVCEDSYQCRYDFGMHTNKELALFTKRIYYETLKMNEKYAKKLLKCDILPTPRFGIKLNNNYDVGTKIIFKCIDGFIMTGDSNRICTINGTWSAPFIGETQCIKFEDFKNSTGNLPLITKFIKAGGITRLKFKNFFLLLTSICLNLIIY